MSKQNHAASAAARAAYRIVVFTAALTLAGAAVPVKPVEAQLQRIRVADRARVAAEVTKAFFGGGGLSWYTSTIRGRLLTPTGERTGIFLDWGLSLAGTDRGSDATLANPELGLVFLDDEGASSGYVSVLLPVGAELGDDDVSVGTAVFSDFTWFDRFNTEAWSVNAAYTPSALLGESQRTRAHFELTASAVIPTTDNDTELFARYLFGLSYDMRAARLRADLEGIAVVSEGDLSPGERTIHHVVIGVAALESGPGLYLRIPLDDDLSQVDAIVGATIAF